MFDAIKRLFARTQPDAGAPVPVPVGDTVQVNAYCTRVEIAQPGFAHILHARRDLSDPALLDHLNGFCHFVLSKGDGNMSADKYHVILHLQRVHHHVSLSVGTSDIDKLHAWAKAANAILFTEDGQVRDPEGRVLVDAVDGKANPRSTTAASAASMAAQGRQRGSAVNARH